MSRELIRRSKREISRALNESATASARLAAEAAIGLLDRSMAFGHRRLAVIRLSVAVEVGAPVSDAHWSYCQAVTDKARDAGLSSVMQRARQQHRRRLQWMTAGAQQISQSTWEDHEFK